MGYILRCFLRHFCSLKRQLVIQGLWQWLDKVFKILIICCFLSSCSSSVPRAPVAELSQPPSYKVTTHTVSRGETLYSIAWRYGLDYKILAAANGIDASYRIYPGQILDLRAKPKFKPKVTRPKQNLAKAPSRPVKKMTTPRSKPLTTKQSPASISKTKSHTLKWNWPHRGNVISRFSNQGVKNKGIDIVGKKGEPVVSAANGKVVYAGEGLRGYGKLLIIKHNKEYLSAYAHNNKILVKEGESVQAGQKIAELGSSGTTSSKLYFEIRKGGKPADPLRYLPKR
ncbi:peptidoglycan DD-metalloendopeptidase family protein [Marinibactrum halimedae]|uniref:peptidoglycan DD-metalloendopeptidase family protein n=1 Tax=Marinibactrum halimedae TaxID=1444977 RepID=UPI0022B7D471|nr:peptidoglycan DD-metalloendopeptidase family protein [Marinibactrum halimedae]